MPLIFHSVYNLLKKSPTFNSSYLLFFAQINYLYGGKGFIMKIGAIW